MQRRTDRNTASLPVFPAADAHLTGDPRPLEKHRFSIIVLLHAAPIETIKEMLDYIQSQTYANWELCIANTNDGANAEAREYAGNLMLNDTRIRYAGVSEKAGVVHSISEACQISTGDHIVLMRQGDILDPHALAEMAKAVEQDPLADIIYADWAEFTGDTREIIKYHFLPDFSPDHLRSVNYIGHMAAYSRGILDRAGFIREGYGGAEAYELLLRASECTRHIAHIRKALYWSRSGGEGYGAAENTPIAVESGRRAIAEHLGRIGYPGEVGHMPDLNAYRIRYALNPAKVSIVIPNKDHARELSHCVSSILGLSTYEDYEILVAENNSADPKTFAYYESIAANPRVRILKTGIRGFNYSAVNNFAARQAGGDYLLLLNNDTKVISPGWIEEMLMFAQRRDVGAVGALLLYRNRTVQHCGLVLGYGGNIAGNYWYGKPFDENGSPPPLRLPRNCSAVTAACLMVKKSDYFAVGGLDEIDFAVGLNDVDFCLKLRGAGLINVWTPYARLYHFESVSRGSDMAGERKERFERECDRLKAKWPRYFADGDPYAVP